MNSEEVIREQIRQQFIRWTARRGTTRRKINKEAGIPASSLYMSHGLFPGIQYLIKFADFLNLRLVIYFEEKEENKDAERRK